MPILTKIWKIWNRTKRTKKNSKPWSDPLTVRNKYTDDPNKISDVLNIHFSSVGRKLASKIPPTTCNFTEYLSGNYSESFFFNSVTALEIEKETFSIPLNKAHGLYSCQLPNQNLEYAKWHVPVSNFTESDYWIYVLMFFQGHPTRIWFKTTKHSIVKRILVFKR